MKTPVFWQSKNALSTALLPLSWLYGGIVVARKWFGVQPQTLSVPVICVGNLTAGGAGKTPTSIAIGERLKTKNVRAYFLSRGYGGSLAGPVLVNPRLHTADEVGDEPLLLARTLPTVVAKNRLRGAWLAMQQGAQVIIMDDGFQNPAFEKTLSILVVDGHYGFGNGRLLPAGPLRETPGSGLARADAVLVIGKTPPPLNASVPVLTARIEPAADARAMLAGKPVLAFCGLAYPKKFFATLEEIGARIVDTAVFADHYPYRDHDIKTLVARARQKNALLVTTAKDAMRLRADLRGLTTVVDITLKLDNPAELDLLLDDALRAIW